MKFANDPSPVVNYRRMLALCGYYLDESTRVLDFGCGSGAFVYAFRDAGFDAHGFDVCNALQLRAPEAARFFQIADKGNTTGEFHLDWTQYRLPFPDATFDFVYSTE